MESLISVITLYDIISMTLPGSLVFCSALLFFREFVEVDLIINNIFFNNAFITVSLFIFTCYCVGWVNSQIAKLSIWSLLKKFLFRNINDESKINIVEKLIFVIICICSLIFLCIAFCLFRITLEVILKCVVMLIILLIILYPSSRKKMKGNTELQQECKDAYARYFGCYPNKSIEVIWTVCYALIQTNSRYNRIHNYNASKSFSKNLGTACIFVSFTSIYFLFTYPMEAVIPGIFIGIISAISSQLMKSRYRFFENRVNELTAIYFIDYVKHMI